MTIFSLNFSVNWISQCYFSVIFIFSWFISGNVLQYSFLEQVKDKSEGTIF